MWVEVLVSWVIGDGERLGGTRHSVDPVCGAPSFMCQPDQNPGGVGSRKADFKMGRAKDLDTAGNPIWRDREEAQLVPSG